jgi:hypothetical protein
MIKKAIAVVLLVCICFSAFSLDMKNAQPYSDDEFPKWSLDLRRGEVIFFGSLPIAYAMTSLVSSKLINKDLTFWQTMAISAGVSTAITVLDYILGLGSGK